MKTGFTSFSRVACLVPLKGQDSQDGYLDTGVDVGVVYRLHDPYIPGGGGGGKPADPDPDPGGSNPDFLFDPSRSGGSLGFVDGDTFFEDESRKKQPYVEEPPKPFQHALDCLFSSWDHRPYTCDDMMRPYRNTKPGDGNTQPGDGDTKPGDCNTQPGDGNTQPGDGNTQPVVAPSSSPSLKWFWFALAFFLFYLFIIKR